MKLNLLVYPSPSPSPRSMHYAIIHKASNLVNVKVTKL